MASDERGDGVVDRRSVDRSRPRSIAVGPPLGAASTWLLASQQQLERARTSSVGTPKSTRQATSSTPTAETARRCSAASSGVPNRPLVLEVALGGDLEQLVELVGGQRLEQVVGALAPAGERRERRRDVAQQADRGAEVALHRLAGDLARRVGVAVEVGVQHQRDAALAGVPGVAPRGAVALDVLGRAARPTGRAGG